jgi:fused signal recognition particle receptor
MAFDWFRRQFTQPKDASESKAEPLEEQQEAAEVSAEGTSSDAETVQEDYLAWAKAAYQNIQQRQQAPAEAVELASPLEPAPQHEAIAPDAVTVETPTLEVQNPEPDLPEQPSLQSEDDTLAKAVYPSDPEVLDVATEPKTADSWSREVATPPLPTPDIQTAEISSASAPVEPATPLPLWAKADADRQARLDRLKATAIEETAAPEKTVPPTVPSAPPIKPPIASPVTPPSPAGSAVETAETADSGCAAIAFDDGFLWSAEVLASQGRNPEDISADEISWLQKLRQGLGKTRRGFVNQIKAIVGQGPLNQDAVMEIESLLLLADVGVEATDTIVAALQAKMREETLPPDAAFAYLKTILRDILDAPIQANYSSVFAPEKDTLNIWLMTGVNGAGKTTTIGKIAHVATESGFNCLVAAADTFRAAAVEQVKVWAQRSNVEVIANPGQNTDPAAVVFDAIAAAQSRHTELLLVDTAGRLQNKKNLMDELRKVRQIIDKKAPHAKVESLLVLDATLGQNGLRQAQVFSESAQLSGVVLTKLDGTAKGGVALAVVQQLGLPIRFIGAGEGIKDLRPFSSYEFVEALLSSE